MSERPGPEQLLKLTTEELSATQAEYEFFVLLAETLAKEPDGSDRVISWALKRLKTLLKADLVFWTVKGKNRWTIKELLSDEVDLSLESSLENLIEKNEVHSIVTSIKEKKTRFIAFNIPSTPNDFFFPAAIVFPLEIKDVVYGVVTTAWDRKIDDYVKERYHRILGVFTTILGYVLANEKTSEIVFRQAQKDLSQITKRYDFLQVICSKTGSFTPPEELEETGKESRKNCLKGILDYIVKGLSVEMGCIYVKDKRKWKWETGSGDKKKLQKLCEANLEKYFSDNSKSLLNKVRIEDKALQLDKITYRDERFIEENLKEPKVYSLMAAPIRVKGEVEGIIALFNRRHRNPFEDEFKEGNFTQDDLDLLYSVTNPLSLIFKFYHRLEDRTQKIKRNTHTKKSLKPRAKSHE